MQRPREWFLLLLLSILELWGGQRQVFNPNVTPAAPILPLRSRCPHDVSVSSVSARPNHDIFSINLVAISVNRNCCRRYYCARTRQMVVTHRGGQSPLWVQGQPTGDPRSSGEWYISSLRRERSVHELSETGSKHFDVLWNTIRGGDFRSAEAGGSTHQTESTPRHVQ